MRWVHEWRLRLRSLFGRRAVEGELDEELRFHLEQEIERNLTRGMGPKEARRRALVELGGIEQVKEECRDARGVRFLEIFMQDVRFGLRMLRRSPGFTAIAVLTLGLGIGANTAIFSVMNGVLLNPLPYPHPDRLVTLAEKTPLSLSTVSYPNFLDWQRENHTFSSVAAYKPADFDLTGTGKAERVSGMLVSATFFPLLGVNPVIGRIFTPGEDRLHGTPVVMLSGGFWKRKFGGSPDVLGRTITLDGTPYTIIGVIPENFYFCCQTMNFRLSDVYAPLGASKNPFVYDRGAHPGIGAVGRRKPGVTLAEVRADMDGVARNLAAAFPKTDRDVGVAVLPLKKMMVGHIEPFLLVLMTAVGFVLLIACVNVANLLLARSTGRAREFAIRAALGATQKRVVRQLLTESVLLAMAGGALGLLLAAWGTQAALRVLPQALPRANGVRLDTHVLAFTLVISVVVGVLFGLAPALKGSHPNLHERLKEGGRGVSGSGFRTQSIFVVSEMALAVVLLVGAGLTIRSLARLWNVNVGFDPHSVLTLSVALPPSTARKTPEEIRASLRHLTDAVAAVPGVKAVSLTNGAMPMNGDSEMAFWNAGQPKPPSQNQMPVALWYLVGPQYLNVMRIPLLRGRFLTDRDDAHGPLVGVIDENFARRYFRNQNPIGKRIDFVIGNIQVEIVGVVGHINQWGLDKDANGPIRIQLYTSLLQIPDKYMPLEAKTVDLVVRTQTPNHASAAAIRTAVEQMNSEQAAFNFASMDGIVSDSLASRRFTMLLLSVFAALALALASIGIYGVMSYVAGTQTHEIGIRMALGAERLDVLRMVLGQGTKMALAGVGIGLAAALGLTRLMTRMLFGVSPRDPITFLGVGAVLALVALAACYLPARRAMRVDPMTALRHE
jgi:predicted permease